MTFTTLHLRGETKLHEERSALTPTTAKALLAVGYKINVERSPVRIFQDSEFEEAGATLVPEGSWVSSPEDHVILGLKELPEDEDFPLHHTHVQFAHCYKGQSNWREVLSRFPRGGGTLYDLEFLTDDSGRRVAAYGYYAGYTGAAVAIMVWHWQLEHGRKPMPALSSYKNEGLLIEDVKGRLKAGAEKSGHLPQAIVIGALGRCGKGAIDMFKTVGIPESNLLRWDMAETAKGGPFEEIVESDIFVNCIYLTEKIAPFVNMKALANSKRKLSVVCDVSCDPTSESNPVQIYKTATTFHEPTVPVAIETDPPLSVIAIDHLPSMLPREASESFSSQLLPSLLELNRRKESKVWSRAEQIFKQKCAEL